MRGGEKEGDGSLDDEWRWAVIINERSLVLRYARNRKRRTIPLFEHRE